MTLITEFENTIKKKRIGNLTRYARNGRSKVRNIGRDMQEV